jgi:replication factor C small subunit
MSEGTLWVDKYRPTSVKDMCLHPDLVKKFTAWESGDQDMPHMTLCGPAGIGKTTLARILSEALSSDIEYVHCGRSGSVDDIRTRINEFCMGQSFDGRNKTVIFDEADGLSKNAGSGSSAQEALRGIIEESQHDTRFILTCNYPNKLIDPIKSRCPIININFSEADVLKKCRSILDNEGVEYDKETLIVFYERVVKRNFPDVRSVVNVLQMWVIDNKLTEIDVTTDAELDELVDKIMKLVEAKKFNDARKLWINHISAFAFFSTMWAFD